MLIRQKQRSRGVLGEKCSEKMRQIYRRTPIPKCDFNKVAKQHLSSLLKKNTAFMAKSVLVGATQLDLTYNKVSLWTRFGRFSSMMTVVITKKPREKEISGAWDQVKIQNICFHSIMCANFYENRTCQTFKIHIYCFYRSRFLPGLWILRMHKKIKIIPETLGVMTSKFHRALVPEGLPSVIK